jgi:hypothetical protein
MTGADELEAVARALCLIDGVDPDSTVDKPGRASEPPWHSYRERARREFNEGAHRGERYYSALRCMTVIGGIAGHGLRRFGLLGHAGTNPHQRGEQPRHGRAWQA